MHPCYSTVARRGLTIACIVALAACATTGIKLAAAPVHPHSFDGHWVVDVSHSEDPDASPGASGGGRGMGGGHGHGGGGGMGGGGMGGGGMGGGGRHGGGAGGSSGSGAGNANGGGNSGGNGDMLRRALLLPDTLDIALHPDNLQIAPNGHSSSVPMVTGKDTGATGANTTRAGWDGDDLVVVIHIDDKRGDIVQHYAVAADHSRLVVTTEFKRKSKTVSVVREFTAATPPPA
jgi:hypothetical protein